jgi:hypothetical protein
MSFKVLKSQEENSWLFDATINGDSIKAGLACFTPHCPSEVQISINGVQRIMIIPSRAIGSPVPSRILGARLSLLPLQNNE